MRFLDEKLEVSGQFRADHAIDPMLNAWASVSRVTQSHQPAKSASQICTRRLPQTRKPFSSLLSRLPNCFGQLNLILTKRSKFQML